MMEDGLYVLTHTSAGQGFRLQTRGFPGCFSFLLDFWILNV